VRPLLVCTLALLGAGMALQAAEAPQPEKGLEVQDFWPFYSRIQDERRTETQIVGPFGFANAEGGRTESGIRPLYAVVREPARDLRILHVLYPFSFFRTEGDASLRYAFPFHVGYSRPHANKEPVGGSSILGLIWYGTHPSGGPWFFIFPLGGVGRGLLGFDECLFALNLYIRFRIGDYTMHHCLWPFFGFSKGPNRRALRLWPLYGRAEHEGKWVNGYWLWPFYTWGRREGNANKPAGSQWYLFPLFGRSRSRDGASGSRQVLWPFFFYGWNTETGYREWDMPWPFITGRHTKDLKTTNFWPFYGQRVYGAGADRFYLWPFFHTSRVRARTTQRDTVGIFPFFKYSARVNESMQQNRRYWMLWPLWRSRSRTTEKGPVADANSLQLAWFRFSEGFDRTFNALFGLYRHNLRADGRKTTAWLWEMFRYDRGPGGSFLRLWPLGSWVRSPGLTRSSYLLGLVQTGRREGRRGWRILFIPFGARL